MSWRLHVIDQEQNLIPCILALRFSVSIISIVSKPRPIYDTIKLLWVLITSGLDKYIPIV